MHTILLAVEDPALRDQIRTAMKIFPSLRPVNVPRDHLLDLLKDQDPGDAVILDHERSRSGTDPFLAELRAINKDITVLVVGERPDRSQFNRAKVELNVLSMVPLPLDPYDLARRLHRLCEHLGAA